MTKFTHTNITQSMTHPIYRIALLVYIIYFTFSPQVFAQEAQAPDQRAARQLAMVEPAAFEGDEIIKVFVGAEQEIEEDTRALQIAAYYARYNLPLGDYSESFIESADRHGIDWKLLPAIGFIESTGGKHACQTASYSPFGWGSCKINFDSYEEAIDVVAMNLGGHNPNTAYYYKDKELKEALYAYNSVIPDYRQKILLEMHKIENQEV